ncbi:MAG TPA: hypothetical protein VHW45_12635, partial [Candidatus Sulfotelmatobacter sp.]|nr:hypothetical protein [Candidatus Sulfotelmatobacter sp.]
LMGHKTIQMTMRYAHLAPEHKLQAVKRLAAFAPQNKDVVTFLHRSTRRPGIARGSAATKTATGPKISSRSKVPKAS